MGRIGKSFARCRGRADRARAPGRGERRGEHRRPPGRRPAVRPDRRRDQRHRGDRRQAAGQAAQGDLAVRRGDDHGRRPCLPDPRRAGHRPARGVVSGDRASGWPRRGGPDGAGRGRTVRLSAAAHGAQGRVAIPLSLVARLEEIPCSAIEHSADREVVQYRGQIMPLVRLSQALGHRRRRRGRRAATRCRSSSTRSKGRASAWWSTRSSTSSRTRPGAPSSRRAGLIGSAVIQHRVTDVVDVPGLIRSVDPGPDGQRRRGEETEPWRASDSSARSPSTASILAIDVLEVQEVIRYQEMTRVPRPRRWCAA